MNKLKNVYTKTIDFLHLIGVNKAVLFGVLSKVWLGASGIITIYLIVKHFSPELQGYYFTFYSLLSLQIIVDLGLTAVIVNFASHEWSKLSFSEEGFIIGDKNALSRLRSLAKIVFLWYAIGAVILAVGLGLAGYFFFSYSGGGNVNWLYPWLWLCVLTAINLGISPSFALLVGCNQVAQIYLFRFVQEIFRTISIWLVIIVGGGLWAPSISFISVLVWSIFYLIKYYRHFIITLLQRIPGPRLNWREEILPMQWRLAVSWISGFFYYSLFVPFLFYFHGAVVAGQMGLTWKVTNAVVVIAAMWTITRAPQFGILAAKDEYKKLDRLFFKSMLIAVVIASLGALIIFAFICYMNISGHSWADRFLSPFPTAFFLLSAVLMQITNAQAIYLHAHKKEPFMWLSVTSSLMMILLLWFAGGRWGATGIAVSFFLLNAMYGIPCGSIIWHRCRKSWYSKSFLESFNLSRKGIFSVEEEPVSINP